MLLKKTAAQAVIAGLGAVAVLLSGCADMNEQQRQTAAGTGIGAGVGALGGYAWSQYMASKKA